MLYVRISSGISESDGEVLYISHFI